MLELRLGSSRVLGVEFGREPEGVLSLVEALTGGTGARKKPCSSVMTCHLAWTSSIGSGDGERLLKWAET